MVPAASMSTLWWKPTVDVPVISCRRGAQLFAFSMRGEKSLPSMRVPPGTAVARVVKMRSL